MRIEKKYANEILCVKACMAADKLTQESIFKYNIEFPETLRKGEWQKILYEFDKENLA